jgi:hypothetical protein
MAAIRASRAIVNSLALGSELWNCQYYHRDRGGASNFRTYENKFAILPLFNGFF